MKQKSGASFAHNAAHDTKHNAGEFVRRHIGLSECDIRIMLEAVGFDSFDHMAAVIIPKFIALTEDLNLDEPLSEADVLQHLRELADKNTVFKSLIGQGYYNTITPSVILRNVLENPAWYTSYTPYQPEISQGRLEALLNFQTMVSEMTALPIANASLLDEATAAAEAMTLMRKHTAACEGRDVVCVAEDCFEQTKNLIIARAKPLGIQVRVLPVAGIVATPCFGAIVQYPAASGAVENYEHLINTLHANGALVTTACDILSLALLKPPGELGTTGADIAVGSTQRFGVPLFYGGPHAAFFATKDEYKRSIPGRIIGVSVDSRGRPALRLSLQTREQHIRRERATSNICTAQALLAICASFYALYHGPRGITHIARRVHALTCALKKILATHGIHTTHETFFDTLSMRVANAAAVHKAARERGLNFAELDCSDLSTQTIGISLDETCDVKTLVDIARVFGIEDADIPGALDTRNEPAGIPAKLVRTSAFLAHPVFSQYHSETQMMRYMRCLADKDIALDRSMIPLGSCTMKLNAATEMLMVFDSRFADIHPFAPLDQAQGYVYMIEALERMLAEVTGYDEVSLQPNSGAQGEYAGLLAIRDYHISRGNSERTKCLIPASAHGTNPASAVMVGMDVVVVACDSHGNIDFDDLRAKVAQYSKQLAAIMITYPSTHGVFEHTIMDVCDLAHEHGGQVYMDGANLNAQLGLAKPGAYGSDVSHLNLHKTFCIPHGGGGPGVGPIGVKKHLKEFLPSHWFLDREGYAQTRRGSTVSAAPFGSAGILSISYAYMKLMGKQLAEATRCAILSANYIAKKLDAYFPVLYKSKEGYVAHECIIDVRPLTSKTGVSLEDVAKRLIDHGFHAPTMAWPVPGTLMIEPTESENLRELDRFCDAMRCIHDEAMAVVEGQYTPEQSPLRNAPHTARDITDDSWNRPYSREVAVFPAMDHKHQDTRKYWPPVNRIDNVAGDKNLVCACAPPEAYE